MVNFERVSSYPHAKLPKRQTKGSAGYDFYLPDAAILQPGQVTLIPLGIKAQMEDDMYLKIYVRSSIGAMGLIVPSSVGIIDNDYYNNEGNEGNIHLILFNMSSEVIKLQADTRVCQGIFTRFDTVDNEEPINAIRNGGLGSTG